MTTEKKESLVKKIKALLEKTVANGCTEEEANSAATLAQKLMDDYGVTLGEIEAATDKKDFVEQGVFETNLDGRANASMDHVHFCGHAVARFCGCEYFVRGSTKMVYFGFKADTEIAKYLTEVFRVAMRTEWKKWYAVESNKASLNGFRKRGLRDFCVGMARRLSERLDDMVAEREAAMKPKSNSRALVVVKSQIVADAYAELSKHFKTSRSRGFTVGAPYSAGYVAGNNVNIPAGGLDDKQHSARLK